MKESDNFLRNALKANALFSFVSGTIFAAFYNLVGAYIGIEPHILTLFLGIGLIGFSLFVWIVGASQPINQHLVWLIIFLDILWILGTAYSMYSDIIIYSNMGIWTMVVLSVIVMDFAIAQYIGLRKLSPVASTNTQ